MTVSPQTHHMIAYGSGSVRSGALAALAAGKTDDVDRPGAPFVWIACSRSRPVRLHSLAHPFTLPPRAPDMRRGASQLAFLEAHLTKLCGHWWRPGRQFVSSYFREVHAAVAAQLQDLGERTAGLSGLIEAAHWAFSALMPFPRAHIRPAGGRTLRREDFVPADFAFWTGKELVAVRIDTGQTVTAATRRAQARLSDQGVRIASVTLPGRIPAQPPLLKQLGQEFQDFLVDERLPQTPFRSRSATWDLRTNSE